MSGIREAEELLERFEGEKGVGDDRGGVITAGVSRFEFDFLSDGKRVGGDEVRKIDEGYVFRNDRLRTTIAFGAFVTEFF